MSRFNDEIPFKVVKRTREALSACAGCPYVSNCNERDYEGVSCPYEEEAEA